MVYHAPAFPPSAVILIPAFNESATIADLVRLIRKTVTADVVVIDDACTDDTARDALDAGATVLSHPLRAGAWGAIRTGFRYADRHGYDIAVTMDADGQHLPQYIERIVEPVRNGSSDVVIGAYCPRAGRARRSAWAFFRNLTKLGINDLTSGFRAYNRNAIRELLRGDTCLLDYQDIGVLLHLKKSGITVSEIPVNMCLRVSGHSRIFSSWLAVTGYLLHTGVLCISKLKQDTRPNGENKRRHPGNFPSPNG